MSAPTKTRKLPAKQRGPVQPDVDEDVQDAAGDTAEEPRPVGPVRIGARPSANIDVFELDGVMYRAPAEPSAALVIEYLRQVRKAQKLKGAAQTLAQAEALENFVVAILGAEAWQTLGESPDVTVSDVSAVVEKIATEIAFPAVQKFVGASGNG